MALIAGTNSYITAAEITAYATARGITLTGDPDILGLKAMDYLATLESSWQGQRTDAMQPLAWPRYPVYLYGTLIGDDVIPQQLKDAQAQLAIEAYTTDLLPTVSGGAKGSIIEETVDVITVKYAEGQNNTQPIFTAVNALLKPLFGSSGLLGASNFSIRKQ